MKKEEKYFEKLGTIREKLHKNLQESEYLRFRLLIKTGYEWGSGWSSLEEAHLFQYEVRGIPFCGMFTEGDIQVRKGEMGSCDTLFVPDTPMDVYVHPMELTGYATFEQIMDLVAIFAHFRSVKGVGELQTAEVYDLSDHEYRRRISDLTLDILEAAKMAKNLGVLYDFAFDFAKECRIPRVGDSSCYSNLDTDIELIENIVKTFKSLSFLDEAAPAKVPINERTEFIGQIIDIFEDFLEEKGIDIPNDEKAESEGPAIIYGTDYGELQSCLEGMMLNWSVIEPYPEEVNTEKEEEK